MPTQKPKKEEGMRKAELHVSTSSTISFGLKYRQGGSSAEQAQPRSPQAAAHLSLTDIKQDLGQLDGELPSV
jgi:hypothetical protein